MVSRVCLKVLISDPEHPTKEGTRGRPGYYTSRVPLGDCSMAVLLLSRQKEVGLYFLERFRAGPVLFPERLRDGVPVVFQ